MSEPSEKPNETPKPKPDILAATPGVSVNMVGECTDMQLLPWTYPWPKRILCFIAWKVPPFCWVTRWFARGVGLQSPYGKVVALIRPRPTFAGIDLVKQPEEE